MPLNFHEGRKECLIQGMNTTVMEINAFNVIPAIKIGSGESLAFPCVAESSR